MIKILPLRSLVITFSSSIFTEGVENLFSQITLPSFEYIIDAIFSPVPDPTLDPVIIAISNLSIVIRESGSFPLTSPLYVLNQSSYQLLLYLIIK